MNRRTPILCRNCRGTLWVCENHPDKPFDPGPEGCECGAGQPCECNPSGVIPTGDGDLILNLITGEWT